MANTACSIASITCLPLPTTNFAAHLGEVNLEDSESIQNVSLAKINHNESVP